jgi:hypothetical protein
MCIWCIKIGNVLVLHDKDVSLLKAGNAKHKPKFGIPSLLVATYDVQSLQRTNSNSNHYRSTPERFVNGKASRTQQQQTGTKSGTQQYLFLIFNIKLLSWFKINHLFFQINDLLKVRKLLMICYNK